MKIGIVILNYKTYSDTLKLMNHIMAQSTSHDLYFKIIDNNSPNRSFEVLSNAFADVPNIKVIQSGTNSGYAQGNNIGLKALEEIAPDYVLVINNDIFFDLKILDDLISAYRTLPSPGLISPIQLQPDGTVKDFDSLKCNTFWDDFTSYSLCYAKLFKKRHEYKADIANPRAQKVDIVEGCFVFTDYALFKEIGWFDESTFLFCEERFLFKKLQKIGRQNYILLDSYYIHDHSKTIRESFAIIHQQKMMLDGRIAFTKRYRKFASLKIRLMKSAFWMGKIEYRIIHIVKSLLTK